MSEAVVAKRYADALFQLGNEKATVEQLVNDLRLVKDVFQVNKQLVNFLEHPRIGQDDKKKFIDNVFEKFQKDVVNTLKLLVERHRINITVSVIDNFIELYNEANGIADATVYSVRELTDAEREELETSFKNRFDKQSISITNIVDPSLIGGMRIRIGNTIYDGSIKGKLNRIERNIISANK